MKNLKVATLLLFLTTAIACKDNEKANPANAKEAQSQKMLEERKKLQIAFDTEVSEYQSKVEIFLSERGCAYIKLKKRIVCGTDPTLSPFNIEKDKTYVYSSLSPNYLSEKFLYASGQISMFALGEIKQQFKCLVDMVEYSSRNYHLRTEYRSAATERYQAARKELGFDRELNDLDELINLSTNKREIEEFRHAALALIFYLNDKEQYAKVWSEIQMMDLILKDQTEKRAMPETLVLRHVFQEKDAQSSRLH